jgi:hypothetical protein
VIRLSPKDVAGFARVWKYKGVSIILPDAAMQFALDFAQLALTQFAQQVQTQAVAAAKAKQIVHEA